MQGVSVGGWAEDFRAKGYSGILLTQNDGPPLCAAGGDCYGPCKSEWFDDKHHPPRDWDLSVDHFPKLKMCRGVLEPGNIRPMHVHCNRVDYSNLALENHLLALNVTNGPIDRRAVAVAMEEHLNILDANGGRGVKGRKPRKAADRLAREEHALFGADPAREVSTPRYDRWRARSSDPIRAACAGG